MSSKPRKTATNPQGLTVSERMDAFGGIDALCERIEDGESMASIARSLHILKGELTKWVAADEKRSARAKESRTASAQHWDMQAESILLNADVTLSGSIAQARELAQHYRWRASKYAPKDYGDKLDVTADVTIKDLSDEQLRAKAIALAAKIGDLPKI